MEIGKLVFLDIDTSKLNYIDSPQWVKRMWLLLGHEFGIKCTCGELVPTIPRNGMCSKCGDPLVWGKMSPR